jgi:hypothetical protein
VAEPVASPLTRAGGDRTLKIGKDGKRKRGHSPEISNPIKTSSGALGGNAEAVCDRNWEDVREPRRTCGGWGRPESIRMTRSKCATGMRPTSRTAKLTKKGNLRHESLTANVPVNPFGNEDQESREGRQDAEFDE